jgi:hypothetical protein
MQTTSWCTEEFFAFLSLLHEVVFCRLFGR